uniref:Protein kinase domain-containing protein n=1 Tax=Oryza meridionalis TaxID=40149 RepID=A0A0E0CAS5_9ORYZ
MKPIMDRINIFIEAVCGANYLHTKGVVHRDLKPDNIFLDEHGKSDVFSLGIIYAELFGPPAGTAERREWLTKLRKLIRSQKWKKAPLSTWEGSELSKDWTGDSYLMIKMLETSPELRPSCKRILEVL